MKKIGITGQTGFMGSHLYNFLSLRKEELELIPFEDSHFSQRDKLFNFVKKCDAIIHLAAINRHGDQNVIYQTNINLIKQLINALEEARSTPQILFASSTQEERDNLYGKSKKEGRKLLQKWAKKNNAKFTGLIIPNVFGPFGMPFYNSVISTFSYQLTNNLEPKIEIDVSLRLIYINDLLNEFLKLIHTAHSKDIYYVPFYKEIKVSEILKKLMQFKELYYDKNIIPRLSDKFEIDLFNTFRSYIALETYCPFHLKKNEDARGYLVETIKEYTGGQVFFSVTKPGITRGNHFHIRKIERFCVIKGEAEVKLRKIGTEKVISFYVSSQQPATIDMPIWYTHNINNIGSEDLLTLFWCNEIFDPSDSDTYFEEV